MNNEAPGRAKQKTYYQPGRLEGELTMTVFVTGDGAAGDEGAWCCFLLNQPASLESLGIDW
jgi:hypothetical protein